MFESLSDRIQEIIRKTSGNATLTEENMSDALREIRRALLEADVNLRVVKAFINAVKEKAEGEAVLKSVSPAQQLIKIVNDELIVILGGEKKGLELHSSPSIIMMLGLQGSGKTTSSAKLAIKLKKEGKKPLLVACDVYRPAAVKQLITLGEQTETPVFIKAGQALCSASVSSPCKNQRNIKERQVALLLLYAGVAELADAQDLGSCGRPCRFKSVKKPHKTCIL